MKVSFEQALALLKEGQVVAIPTETVYGLAASLDRPDAIQNIFKLKGRPSSNPLIIHVATIDTIKDFALDYPPNFHELAKSFWPGPLTIILPVKIDKIPGSARANLPTAAFRIPNHELTRKLLLQSGPLVMPSANLSGKPSATDAAHVEEDFGLDFPVLDAGRCIRGLESTIMLYEDEKWVVGRMGAIPLEDIASVLGYMPAFRGSGENPVCPGQHYRHYAPKAELFLQPNEMPLAEVIVGFKERKYVHDKKIIHMGSLNNPQEVGENLYSVLRQLDLNHISSAWIDMDFPLNGLWITIEERLRRASKK